MLQQETHLNTLIGSQNMFSVKRDNLIFQIYWTSQVKILIDLTEHLNNKNFSFNSTSHKVSWGDM